jgi:hypothetical protein
MPGNTLLTALQSQTERDLTETVLVPLFGAMGYERVSLEGGAHESGRDMVCWGSDELGEPRIVVVQVKHFRPDTRTASPRSLMILLQQIEQALESPLALPDGTSRAPTSAILVTPFVLSQAALSAFHSKLAHLHQRRVSIVDGPRLAELVGRYLPALASRLSGSEMPAVKRDATTPAAGILPIRQGPGGELLDYLSALRADIDRRIGPSEPIDRILCFVIMSFSSNPVLADFYEKAIKPTVEQLGYRCERIDEQQFNDRITERIFLNLRTARLVVADLTEARPNCYYELGIAHALRKEVIHLAYAGQDIHFDVKDWNFIIYSRLDELARALRERILGTVGRGGAEPADG